LTFSYGLQKVVDQVLASVSCLIKSHSLRWSRDIGTMSLYLQNSGLQLPQLGDELDLFSRRSTTILNLIDQVV
jgi:hypothetical protein